MSKFGNAIAGIGAGVSGFVKGSRLREQDDFLNLERDQKREAIELGKQFQNDINGTLFTSANATNGIAANDGSAPAPEGVGAGQEGNVPAFEKLHNIYQKYSMQMATNPYAAQTIKPALDNVRSMAMVDYAKSFKGDTSTLKGSIDYARYMAKGAGMFGDPMSPDQALKMAELSKKIDDEGYMDALKAAHSGDASRAEKVWNETGTTRGKIVELRPSTFQLGGQTFKTNDIVYEDQNGQQHTVNAFGAMYNAEALKSQVDMQLSAKRVTNEGNKSTRSWESKEVTKRIADIRAKVASGELAPEEGRAQEAAVTSTFGGGIGEAGGGQSLSSPSSYEEAFRIAKERNPDAPDSVIDANIMKRFPDLKKVDKQPEEPSKQEATPADTKKQYEFKNLQRSLINKGHSTAPEMVINFDKIAKDLSPAETKKLLDIMGPYITGEADRSRYNLVRRKYIDEAPGIAVASQ